MMQNNGGMCPCPHHKVRKWATGTIVILIGLTIILKAMGIVAVSWSIIGGVAVILWGLKMLTRGMCKCCDKR